VSSKNFQKFLQKFFRHVIQRPDGCWEWTGYRDGTGYGRFNLFTGCNRLAHRFSYEAHHGKIPAGKIVRHLCNWKWCVNPHHLEIGTHIQNMTDVRRKGEAKQLVLAPMKADIQIELL
jgi:HNH endonuclease